MRILCLEVMQKELKITQDLIIKDHNILVANSLIDLVARLQLQNQISNTERTTWHHALTMISRVHKEFIETYGLLPPTQPQ